jgi:hypothetical protein
MPDLTLWGLFIAASVVLLLTPGPAVLYIVAHNERKIRDAKCPTVKKRKGCGAWRSGWLAPANTPAI